MKKGFVLFLLLTVLALTAGPALAVFYYGYATTTPGCDYHIRVILKDADFIDEPPGYDVVYHIDSSADNLILIKDIQNNTDCVFYYDVVPACNNTPRYCLQKDFITSKPVLRFTGTSGPVFDKYGGAP